MERVLEGRECRLADWSVRRRLACVAFGAPAPPALCLVRFVGSSVRFNVSHRRRQFNRYLTGSLGRLG